MLIKFYEICLYSWLLSWTITPVEIHRMTHAARVTSRWDVKSCRGKQFTSTLHGGCLHACPSKLLQSRRGRYLLLILVPEVLFVIVFTFIISILLFIFKTKHVLSKLIYWHPEHGFRIKNYTSPLCTYVGSNC